MNEQLLRHHQPTATLQVAVLDDDTQLREAILLPTLRDFGFGVRGAATAAELYRHMLSHHFDIVVLDIGLPGEDGLTVARHLRTLSNLGIVMLTGNHGAGHHARALHNGADFYLTKPVDMEVLAATLHSLARRMALTSVKETPADYPGTTRWCLEAGGWRLVSPKGCIVALTAPEHCIVSRLAANNGTAVSRESLIRALTENVYDFDPHRLEMMVHRLRRKAHNRSGETLPLLTARGEGYLLKCDYAQAAEEPCE
jgi:two-component system, OmpR family, response regulator PhoP